MKSLEVKVNENLGFHSVNSSTPLLFKVPARTHGVLVGFPEGGKSRSAEVFIFSVELSADEIEKFFKEKSTVLESNPVSYKALGPKNICQKIETIVSALLPHTTLKTFDSLGKAFEVLIPCDGTDRVRVAMASEVPAASKVEPVQNSSTKKTRVLVVDDSKTIRDLLQRIIGSDPSLECVAVAERPSQVESLLQSHRPDVVTLDINMPEMDGVTLLSRYLPKYPVPTVMISAVSMEDGEQVLNALRLGAVDYIQKPNAKEMHLVAPLIIEKIKIAAKVKVSVRTSPSSLAKAKPVIVGGGLRTDLFLAIGASTGGTEAIREVLEGLPEEIPPVLIAQHIPPVFSAAFAKRLNEILPFEVREAKDGDPLLPSTVLIAPGGAQMKVERSPTQPGGYVVRITDDAPVNRHKPSVDYLFDSVAELLGKRAIGLILTGMGADGARGLKKIKDAGAFTLAQAEEGCVVFGMPREAIEIGGAVEVVALPKISARLIQKLLGEAKAA